VLVAFDGGDCVRIETSIDKSSSDEESINNSSSDEESTAVDYGEWSEDERITPSEQTTAEEQESSLGSPYIFAYRKFSKDGASYKFKTPLVQDIIVPEDDVAFATTDVESNE
jgi:hypothetical protein